MGGGGLLKQLASLQAEGPCDGGGYGDDHFENGTPYGLFHEL